MRWIDALGKWMMEFKPTWWAWPAFLVGLALISDAASLFLQPLGDAWVAFPGGSQFGEECAAITVTGFPCPQCGMTRSWVHGIRGSIFAAMEYNIAGFALWVWINAAGVIGAVRLITRDPNRAKLPSPVMMGWVLIWLVPLYLGGWIARLMGYNVLP